VNYVLSIKVNTPTLGCERRSHKTNHTSAPVDVVEEISHKSPSLLTGRQQLGEQIGLIFMSVDITSPLFVIGHTLTDKVECDALPNKAETPLCTSHTQGAPISEK
jgi:hypothetical protein